MKKTKSKTNNIRPGDSRYFDVPNGVYSAAISAIYAINAFNGTFENIPAGETGDFGLPKVPAACLSAGCSFLSNFPLAFIFSYTFANFLKNIWYNRNNLQVMMSSILSLALAALPSLAGFDLGQSAAARVWDSEVFKIVAADFMTFNMMCTRTYGINGLKKIAHKVFIEPFKIRNDYYAYSKDALDVLIEKYPSTQLTIDADDYRCGEITLESLNLLIPELTYPSPSCATVCYTTWCFIRKFITSLILIPLAVTMLPLWTNTAIHGWNDIHSGLGKNDILTYLTATPHVLFYSISALQVLYMLVDRLLIPLGQTLYNESQGFLKNVARIVVGVGCYAFLTQFIAYESGSAMAIEASGLDLHNITGGYFSFLDPVYPDDVKLDAGWSVNGNAFSCFVVAILMPLMKKRFSKNIDSILIRIGAKAAVSDEEVCIKNTKQITVSKFEVAAMISDMWEHISPDKEVEYVKNIHNALDDDTYAKKYLGIFKLEKKFKVPENCANNNQITEQDSQTPSFIEP